MIDNLVPIDQIIISAKYINLSDIKTKLDLFSERTIGGLTPASELNAPEHILHLQPKLIRSLQGSD